MVSQPIAAAEIILYKPEHYTIFRQLNMEWLNAYDLVEDHDLEVLEDPQGIILDPGGIIFLAEVNGDVIGSAALIRTGEKNYELAKMCVTAPYRGKGISKLLLERCLEHAKDTGAERILLYSNPQLSAAISLYEKYGFRHIPVINSPFETADVRMELIL